MSTSTLETAGRRVAPVIGFAIAVLVLLSWRIPAASGQLGADVRFTAMPLGEVATEPAGAFASGRGLARGDGEARGRLTLANVGHDALAVRVRGLPSSRDLDRTLRVELRTAGRTLARGPLARLRSWSEGSLTIARGGRAEIDVRAWLPAAAHGAYEGRSVDVTLELRARPVER